MIDKIKQEAQKRYPKNNGYIGSQHDAFIEGAIWAFEQIKNSK